MNGMRRLGPVLLAAVMAVGCVSVSRLWFTGSVSAPKDEAYNCILGLLTKTGYEIESTDRAGGIIKVTRLAPDAAMQSTHDGAVYDFMDFTLMESKDPKKCSLQASLDGYVLTANGEKRPHEASKAARADAWAIINECRIEDVNGIHPVDLNKL